MFAVFGNWILEGVELFVKGVLILSRVPWGATGRFRTREAMFRSMPVGTDSPRGRPREHDIERDTAQINI